MKSISQQSLINQLTEKVEQHMKLISKVYQNLDTQILSAPSTTGGWSIAQCFSHLNSYGDYYLPQIQQRLLKNHTKNSNHLFKSSWLGNYFTQLMLPGEKMKKMKTFKAHTPPAVLDAHYEVGEFLRQQEVILALLKEAANKDLNCIRIPISISPIIKLKLGDVFGFIIAHNERHIQQAARNLPASFIKKEGPIFAA